MVFVWSETLKTGVLASRPNYRYYVLARHEKTSLCCMRKKPTSNQPVHRYSISSFRLTLFRFFFFAWLFFSLFRLFWWRFFVLLPRHNARRRDEHRNYEMAQTNHHSYECSSFIDFLNELWKSNKMRGLYPMIQEN